VFTARGHGDNHQVVLVLLRWEKEEEEEEEEFIRW
jgi:hypothetical protein